MASTAAPARTPAADPRAARPRVRVGVMVNNVGGYSRGVLRGVASFALARAWECRVQGVNESPAADAHALDSYDGVIIQATTVAGLERFRSAGVPVVNVSSQLGAPDVPSVVSDDPAVGRMGAEHFLRRGYRSLAFYAPGRQWFAKLRHEGFAARLADAALPAPLLTTAGELTAALEALDKPLGIMGGNDAAALVVLDACRDKGLKVPDEVAVLGVDNDDLIQGLAFPPLSSIHMAAERIGFEAAALLGRLMTGEAVPSPHRVLVPPIGAVTRQSTDLLAIRDRDVAEAVRYIRDHAGSRISVDDVMRCVSLSRRQLERRFRAALGRSVLDEIRRCRIDRARQLLSETDLTIPQVALACGFASHSYFSVSFREALGVTPGEYRGRRERSPELNMPGAEPRAER